MEKDIIESSFKVDHLLYVFCMYIVCPSFQESYIAWAEGPRMCLASIGSYDFSFGSWFKHKWNNSIAF